MAEWLGTIGVALLLAAFFANAWGWLGSATRRYHGINAVGAGLACTASFQIGFVPFVVLEAAWCAVALVGLARASIPASSQPLR